MNLGHPNTPYFYNISSVQFSRSVVSNCLHGLQHARLPFPSPTPRAYSNSCLLHQWGHPTVSSSVIPFSSCFQSFPASGSFPMSQFFESGGQSIGVLPGANTRDPTHDKVMREKIWQARQIRFSGIPKRPAHEIPPMTGHEEKAWQARQIMFSGIPKSCPRRSSCKPMAVSFQCMKKSTTIKKIIIIKKKNMLSVFLMPASMDYSLISVTQTEGLPRSLPK